MTIWHTRKLTLSALAGLGIRELAVVWVIELGLAWYTDRLESDWRPHTRDQK